jgi:hypothetical protein
MSNDSSYLDDDFLDDEIIEYSDIDITGIEDPDKLKTTMQRIEDYLEQRKLRRTLDDYL